MLFLDSEPIELMGIHLNNIRVREMLKFFLAEFLTGLNTVEKEEIKTHDIKKTITLEDLTNPNQK